MLGWSQSRLTQGNVQCPPSAATSLRTVPAASYIQVILQSELHIRGDPESWLLVLPSPYLTPGSMASDPSGQNLS